MSKSSFSGNISEIPYISADNFTNLNRKAYFLSHCHTDHTEGLYSEKFPDYLKRNEGVFVYMSELSAAIVRYESNNSDIMDFIIPLKLGQRTINIQPDTINNVEEQYLTVTLIPAGHCFGSVMFLFETKYKTVLFTGDFRISINSLPNYSYFYRNKEIIKLDALYVDCTFQFEHREFPKRSESVKYVLKEVQCWLDQGGSIALHCSAKYGYEYVFKEIYEKLGVKVYVGDKCKLYRQFPELEQCVTDNPAEAKIHVCRNRNEYIKSHVNCNINQNGDFLFIHFSAYKWTDYELDDLMINMNKNRLDVCFPTHCSQSELKFFINFFSPRKVVRFPELAGNVDSCQKRKNEVLTEKVKVMKVDSKLLREMFD